jgi:glycosyltransferase involved in cell wall biosynthesis
LNLEPESTQLIRNLFHEYKFIDCAEGLEKDKKIDVIIPVLHSNDLWRENLTSFYREIPINHLIIGDAGCIDDTISIVEKFPRVQIVDHTEISTLGASIADLISRVNTRKFAYLQSDVYLPQGWFAAMESKGEDFAWVGSPMQVVTMLDYKVDYSGRRPLAGAQLGETAVFDELNKFISDDYVYRQEDFVLEEYVRQRGFATGNSLETFHFHQVMRRKTNGMQMKVESISIKLAESNSEKLRVSNTQLYGLIKYCDPKIREVRLAAFGAYQDRRGRQIVRLWEAVRFARKNNKSWTFLVLRFGVKLTIIKCISLISSALLRTVDAILRTR